MIHLRNSRTRSDRLAGLDELAYEFDLSRANLDTFLREKAHHFGHFTLTKSDGTERPIDYPKAGLKKLQRQILERLYKSLRIPSYLHGGLPKRSIFSHAKPHVNQKYVSTFDICNFFPSITAPLLEPVFIEAGFDGPALAALIDLVTLDGRLPQGCPTSSLLANLAFVFVERNVVKFARRHSWNYTRYIDDIAVSSSEPIAPLAGIFYSVLKESDFSLASSKTHHFDQSQRQIVTNLVVNSKLRPNSNFITELKHTLRLCLKHGAFFVATADGISVKSLKGKLNGRISHLKRCDPSSAAKLKGLMYGIKWNDEGKT